MGGDYFADTDAVPDDWNGKTSAIVAINHPETEKQYIAVQIGGSGWLKTGQQDDRLAVFSMTE